MTALKEWLRNNKKAVAALIVVLLGLAGVAIKPEVVDDVVSGAVDIVAPPPVTPVDHVTVTSP